MIGRSIGQRLVIGARRPVAGESLAAACALVALVVATLASAACHGKSATGPSGVAGITFGGPTFALIGGPSVQVTATASLTDGTTATTGVAFAGNAPSVASVTATGLVT